MAYSPSADRARPRDHGGAWSTSCSPLGSPGACSPAYELSKILLADPKALDLSPGARVETRRLFQETDDPDLRRRAMRQFRLEVYADHFCVGLDLLLEFL